jgi:peptide/nickel transport system substrate-binding protein
MLSSQRAIRGLSSVAAVLLVVGAACAPPPPSAQPPAAAPTQAPTIAANTAAAAPTSASAAPTVAPQAPAAAPKPAAPVPTASAAGKPGGVLRIAGEVGFDSLDPHSVRVGWQINAMQNVYSGLIRPGPDLLPQPDLAIKWAYSDPKTLEFTLRQGAKFHNGREVVADDVKYSLERIRDPKVASSYATNLGSIDTVEAADKYRVVIHLKSPDSALLNNLSMAAMAIVPKEVVDQNGDLKSTMVGSGPFMYKDWIPGQKLTLVKNPDYFIPGQPLLDGLEFTSLPDETARLNALRSGQVDYIEPAPTKDITATKDDQTLVVTGGPNVSFVGVTFNTAKKPYDDVRVRQAMSYGIDRQVVIDKVFDGFAKPLLGPPLIPPFWAGNSETYYSYDPNKAKQLLAEAGYPNGFKATLLTDNQSYQPPLSVVLQSEWKKIGIDVQLDSVDSAVSSARWSKGDYEMWALRWWGSDFIDPDGALRPTFMCKASYNNLNYCNPQFDDLMNKALTVSSADERKPIYRDAMKILADEQPWLFLVSFDRYQVMQAFVKGYTAYPNASQYSFREVWLDK